MVQPQTTQVTKYKRCVFALTSTHVTWIQTQTHRQTHPERLVRRGWRGQAGVRSTWPPPLTAPLLKVPVEVSLLLANARIGCFLYGTVPSTAPLFPQDHKYSCCCRCCRKSVRGKNKTNKNIRVSCADVFRQMSSLFIYRNNGRLFQ